MKSLWFLIASLLDGGWHLSKFDKNTMQGTFPYGVLFEEEVVVGNERILFYCDDNIMRWDYGYSDEPENDQQYMSKGSYNPQDCNEAPYNAN